jgi:hypothetical protein
MTFKRYVVPLSKDSIFLPLDSISDVVINEGVSGWKIIYYLIIIQDEKGEGDKGVKLRIGFPVRSNRSPALDRYSHSIQ